MLISLPLIAAEKEECPNCKKAAEQGVNALDTAAATQGSIYDLDVTWKDQQDKNLKLSEFKGKKLIITMGYASCKFACPRIMADLMNIERNLTEDEKKSVHFVFVSIDPENDTPEKLKAFFQQYNVDQTHWHALKGADDSVQELSVALGIRYKKIDNGDFSHSNRILLLDDHGLILSHVDGLGADQAPLLTALRKKL